MDVLDRDSRARDAKQRFESAAADLEGAECLYREKVVLDKAIMQCIKTDEWGATFRLRIVAARGLANRIDRVVELSTAWAEMSFSSISISGTPGWVLYLDPGLIQRILELAAARNSSIWMYRDYFEITNLIDDWVMELLDRMHGIAD